MNPQAPRLHLPCRVAPVKSLRWHHEKQIAFHDHWSSALLHLRRGSGSAFSRCQRALCRRDYFRLQGESEYSASRAGLQRSGRGETLPPDSTVSTDDGRLLLKLSDGSDVLVRPHTKLLLKQQ